MKPYDRKPLGHKIEPILRGIADTLLENATSPNVRVPQHTKENFQNVLLVLMDVISNILYDKAKRENIPMDAAGDLMFSFGYEFRELILKHTGIDTHKLFEDGQEKI